MPAWTTQAAHPPVKAQTSPSLPDKIKAAALRLTVIDGRDAPPGRPLSVAMPVCTTAGFPTGSVKLASNRSSDQADDDYDDDCGRRVSKVSRPLKNPGVRRVWARDLQKLPRNGSLAGRVP
jgi:hypothetical protein